MSNLLDKLKVDRGEGMAGIGADQGALSSTLESASDPSSSTSQPSESADPTDDVGYGQGQELNRAPNTAGGPSFGRTSMIPRHESEALNKLDPRIGYDSDDVRREDLENYEAKYGKPGEVEDGHLRGRDMSGKWCYIQPWWMPFTLSLVTLAGE